MEARKILTAVGLMFFLGGLAIIPLEKSISLLLLVVSSTALVIEKAMGIKVRRKRERSFHIVNLRDGTEYRG